MHSYRCTAAICGIALSLGAAGAQAAFPDRPVTMVVPYAPGAGTDSAARTLAAALQTHWNRPVVVVNLAGADGVIGSQHVLKQPADGYTVLFQIPQMLMWRWTMPQAGIDIQKNFRLIGKIQQSPYVFSIPAKLPAQNMPQLAGFCKSAKPPCAVGTASASGELAAKQIMGAIGLGEENATYVPYKGGAPMMNDLLGGHVAAAMASAVGAIPQAKAGNIRMLAVTTSKRFSLLPEVPSLKELGYDVTATIWYGLMVPRGVPQAAMDGLVAGIKAVASDPTLLESIRSNGAEPVFSSPAEFESDVNAELNALTPLMEKFKRQR